MKSIPRNERPVQHSLSAQFMAGIIGPRLRISKLNASLNPV